MKTHRMRVTRQLRSARTSAMSAEERRATLLAAEEEAARKDDEPPQETVAPRGATPDQRADSRR